MASYSFRAGADIAPSRIVKVSGHNAVVQAASADDFQVGVSHEGTYKAPLSDFASTPLAAPSGGQVVVYGVGEQCLVEAGGAVNAGDLIRADANGKAVPLGATDKMYVGVALQAAAAAGEKILALVMPGKVA